jgi:hypothetical protein
MANPIPVVAVSGGAKNAAPEGAIPLAFYQDPTAVNPVVTALIAAGFGTAGQVLATNATADGFEWVDPT